MGYSTEFSGTLNFTQELKGSQIAHLKTILGQDCREHPEWESGNNNLTFIDLEIDEQFSGIRWDGSEKTYEMTEKVNLVIDQMRKVMPDFGLEGKLSAQGEELGDVWTLMMIDGRAVQKEASCISNDNLKLNRELIDIVKELLLIIDNQEELYSGACRWAELIKRLKEIIAQLDSE